LEACNNQLAGHISLNKNIISARTSHDVLQMVSSNIEKLDMTNLTTALHRIAKFDDAPAAITSEAFRRLCDKMLQAAAGNGASYFSPVGLANTAWACA